MIKKNLLFNVCMCILASIEKTVVSGIRRVRLGVLNSPELPRRTVLKIMKKTKASYERRKYDTQNMI